MPAGWSASLDAALRVAAARVELRLVARMNEIAAAHPRYGLSAGLAAAAERGVRGEPQACRAAVAAGRPSGSAPHSQELGSEGSGAGRLEQAIWNCRRPAPTTCGPTTSSPPHRGRPAVADPERRRRVHPALPGVPRRPSYRRPRRSSPARASCSSVMAGRGCFAPTTAASSSPRPWPTGSRPRRRPVVHRERQSPQQNAYVERFNGTMRDEVLNGETFRSVLEARVVIAHGS